MPIYSFIDEKTKEEFDAVLPFSACPPEGKLVTVEGRKARRTFALPANNAGQWEQSAHGFPYVSNSLPRNLEGCKHTKDGKPIIESQRHRAELQRRHGLVEANLSDD